MKTNHYIHELPALVIFIILILTQMAFMFSGPGLVTGMINFGEQAAGSDDRGSKSWNKTNPVVKTGGVNCGGVIRSFQNYCSLLLWTVESSIPGKLVSKKFFEQVVEKIFPE
ncbi:MAG: hypothetical protein AB2L17_01305 [Lentimicrobium sp.]